MKKSGELMKHPKLDLIQVHNLLDLDTHLKTLREMKEQGRVRYIGITHYTVGSQADLAKVIEREKLDFVQTQLLGGHAQCRRAAAAACCGQGRRCAGQSAVRRWRRCSNPCAASPCRRGPRRSTRRAGDRSSSSTSSRNPAVTAVIPATGKLRHLEDNLAGGRGRLPDAKLRAQIVSALGAT